VRVALGAPARTRVAVVFVAEMLFTPEVLFDFRALAALVFFLDPAFDLMLVAMFVSLCSGPVVSYTSLSIDFANVTEISWSGSSR
jgi:hypothetical protein